MKRIFLVLFTLFFTACSTKTTPIYAVFNTPKIKIADQGFLKEGFGYREIVIYKAGIEPFRIRIKNSFVCLNSECIEKRKFIKSIDKDYPVDLLDKILNRQPLEFLGKIKKIKGGFIQSNSRYYYRVLKNSVLFKDRKKRLIVLIKELK